jgi:hypothetical protein
MAKAKFARTASLVGELDLNAGVIVEITKDEGEKTYRLRDILEKFDGSTISIRINEVDKIKSLEDLELEESEADGE